MAAYLATKRRKGGLAAVLAAAAVLMRQTNAVWVVFMAAEAVLDHCNSCHDDGGGGSSSSSSSKKGQGGSSQEKQGAIKPTPAGGFHTLLGKLWGFVLRAWVLKWELVRQLWGLGVVATAFAAFVVWNGAVVVGDKAHHAPVRHLMQPLYFSLYCIAWLAPVFWSPNALRLGWQSVTCAGPGFWAVWAGACAVLASVVQRSTLVHPFLLADNRHYIFYLWRKVVNRRWWARYALAPLYATSLAQLAGALLQLGSAWVGLFALCTCLVLVPAHLVEFRYFTIPFFILVLNMRTPSRAQLALLVAAYAIVNCVVAGIYLARPFVWVDGTVARFLW
jgi:alpha-1,2-glucosyltransferase